MVFDKSFSYDVLFKFIFWRFLFFQSFSFDIFFLKLSSWIFSLTKFLTFFPRRMCSIDRRLLDVGSGFGPVIGSPGTLGHPPGNISPAQNPLGHELWPSEAEYFLPTESRLAQLYAFFTARLSILLFLLRLFSTTFLTCVTETGKFRLPILVNWINWPIGSWLAQLN